MVAKRTGALGEILLHKTSIKVWVGIQLPKSLFPRLHLGPWYLIKWHRHWMFTIHFQARSILLRVKWWRVELPISKQLRRMPNLEGPDFTSRISLRSMRKVVWHHNNQVFKILLPLTPFRFMMTGEVSKVIKSIHPSSWLPWWWCLGVWLSRILWFETINNNNEQTVLSLICLYCPKQEKMQWWVELAAFLIMLYYKKRDWGSNRI